MINYISVFALGLVVGAGAGIFAMGYYALTKEQNRKNDIATGSPIALELAREMKIKLDNYEERESWA